jgi:hypothetical protein
MSADLLTTVTTNISAVAGNLATVFGAVVTVIVSIFGIKKVYSMITKS